MRTLQVLGHLTDTQLKEKLSMAKGKPEFSRWQILYLIQVGNMHSADLIAPLVSLSRPSIYKIVEGYNKSGPEAIRYASRGGRRRALLSIAEETALLATIETRASQGMIKTANDIRELVEARTQKAVSDDYLWDLLNRNGWKKKMPRPHHPKRTLAEQQEFKKNSPNSWQPLAGR